MRAYPPVNQGALFDDDPGIMSEVETASTGFRRGGKQRSSLPVVRTPSKTLERPLGKYISRRSKDNNQFYLFWQSVENFVQLLNIICAHAWQLPILKMASVCIFSKHEDILDSLIVFSKGTRLLRFVIIFQINATIFNAIM